MLVSELRKEIDKYNDKDLKKIIVELYKRIPKNKKEDYNIDDFIKEINNDKINRNSGKKEVSFEELDKEIRNFLQLVDNGYYSEPNKVVSKKERSAWRFKAKRYYKELSKVEPNSRNGGMATFLLIELFKRLSIGSNRLLFINWDTFKALGVSQSDYYDMILKRIFYDGYSKINLERGIELLDIPKDYQELSYNMYRVFISNLKTADTQEQAIQLLNDKVSSLNEKLKNIKDSHSAFYIKEEINYCVECILEIYLILSEYEIGIKYFKTYYIEERDIEIKEFILLDKLKSLNLFEEWIKEYESNMGKIDYRDSLVKEYNELKNGIEKY